MDIYLCLCVAVQPLAAWSACLCVCVCAGECTHVCMCICIFSYFVLLAPWFAHLKWCFPHSLCVPLCLMLINMHVFHVFSYTDVQCKWVSLIYFNHFTHFSPAGLSQLVNMCGKGYCHTGKFFPTGYSWKHNFWMHLYSMLIYRIDVFCSRTQAMVEKHTFQMYVYIDLQICCLCSTIMEQKTANL